MNSNDNIKSSLKISKVISHKLLIKATIIGHVCVLCIERFAQSLWIGSEKMKGPLKDILSG